eukprot:CAMPEP_0175039198 /NCGR_PEP_ID=MMETSP0052_2-20121109/401_1 /TAXON_ID=51329 ORGANISM="Polytomella parva, Strain SAG 63-3" /NCGR_SAMPLE_ID=MMETSP0052_2 /ASSEMBLY_ACC=CAM_ASM_000194 /LENGTH=236 /DNA_ID=CAMNT_0016300925 /DNA_START=115 /DNA_END=822 /DNA_ORIENTATION=-
MDKGFIEVREYTLKPEGFASYVNITKDFIDVRKEYLPFLGMFTCEVGDSLHRVVHFYNYKDFNERTERRGKIVSDPKWKEFLNLTRPHTARQRNWILLEVPEVYEALDLPSSAAAFAPPTDGAKKPFWELRRYTVDYSNAPGINGQLPSHFLKSYSQALQSRKSNEPSGSLVLIGETAVGEGRELWELWRYPDGQTCFRSQQACRSTGGLTAPTDEGVKVSFLNSSLLNPTSFSVW